jgi:hypothetical protein
MFNHGQMRNVSEHYANPKSKPFTGEDPGVVSNLRLVAKTFVQLQNQRHIADYDNGKQWTRADAIEEFLAAGIAFGAWGKIRNENIAQEYLVSLLIRPRD